jgi:hypothetical protein
VIVETTKDWRFTGFMLGALPGYWLGADDGRPCSPFLSKAMWNQVLLEAGFAGADIMLDDYNEPVSCTTLIVARNTGRVVHADMKGANTANGINGTNGTNRTHDTNGINGSKGINGTLDTNSIHETNGINGTNGTGINGVSKSPIANDTENVNGAKSSTVTLVSSPKTSPSRP